MWIWAKWLAGWLAGKQPGDVRAVHKRATIKHWTSDDRWWVISPSLSFVRSFVCSLTLSLSLSLIQEPFASMKALFYLIIWTLLTLLHTAYLLPSILSHSWYPSLAWEKGNTRAAAAAYRRANQPINPISFRIANYFVLFDVWNCNAHKIKLHPLLPLLLLYIFNFWYRLCLSVFTVLHVKYCYSMPLVPLNSNNEC